MDSLPSADSRTASFHRKRHWNTFNPDSNTQRSSSNGSTARKRVKRYPRTGEQDLRDFVPQGADFSTSAEVLGAHEGIETHYISDDSSEGSEGGVILSTSEAAITGRLAPTMNWNSGSKAAIRTTLGGGRGQSKVPLATEKLELELSVAEPTDLSFTTRDRNSKHAIGFEIRNDENEESRVLNKVGDVETNVDALMDYSQSDFARSTGNEGNHSTQQPRTLTDLSADELRTQMRYTAITKTPEEIRIQPNALVTCLICWKLGHMGSNCPALTCRICSAYNKHFTRACPRSRKCPKCRELGHEEGSCPYKLPRIIASEIICDLCRNQGHTEDDCEMLWRTFRSQTTESLLGTVWMACYNCGSDKHLGNDCPTRLPGKPIRSSTWSMKGLSASGVGHPHPVMHTIRGRATQSAAALNDGSDDESANFYFYRPSITKAPHGQIKMAGKVRGNGIQGGNTRNPDRQPNVDLQKRPLNRYPPPPRNRDGDDSWKPDSYRSRKRQRSFSPEPRYPQRVGGKDGGSRWQPPLPPEPVPYRRGQGGGGYDARTVASQADVYRPMPSAAKSAWVKHRT